MHQQSFRLVHCALLKGRINDASKRERTEKYVFLLGEGISLNLQV
jgi:hypothetical protein